jgi:hypothetical protein
MLVLEAECIGSWLTLREVLIVERNTYKPSVSRQA